MLTVLKTAEVGKYGRRVSFGRGNDEGAAAVSKWTTTIVSAAPGFEFLAVGKHGGKVCSVPVIAWELLMGEGGIGIGGWRPITFGFVKGSPDMAFAIGCPDGRVYAIDDCPQLTHDSAHASVEAWTFSVRARACGHDLEGTA